jgi:hypothetical protein
MLPIQDHLERALDAALGMTFPASDPVAIFVAEPVWTKRERDQLSTERRLGPANGPSRRQSKNGSTLGGSVFKMSPIC